MPPNRVVIRTHNLGPELRIDQLSWEWLLSPSKAEHQVPNPDSNLDHNPHGRGGLSPDLNPVCLPVNATSPDQDLDQNPYVNGAIDTKWKNNCIV